MGAGSGMGSTAGNRGMAIQNSFHSPAGEGETILSAMSQRPRAALLCFKNRARINCATRAADHFGLFVSNFILKAKNSAFDKSGSVTWSTRVGDSLG